MSKPPFNPTEAQWAQIRQQPKKLQHVEGLGELVFMGDIETPEQLAQLRETMANMHKYLLRETDLKGLKKKRPMIERTSIFVEGVPKCLRDVTHRQFREWAIEWFKKAGFTSIEWGPPNTSAKEREDVLKQMVKYNISPLMQAK